jgi:hypothetical protein
VNVRAGLVAAALLAGAASEQVSAQVPMPSPRSRASAYPNWQYPNSQSQQQQPQLPTGPLPPNAPGQLPVPPLTSPVPGTMMPAARNPAFSGWVLPNTGATFEGFPVMFPQQLRGYGSYPAGTQAGGDAGGRGALPLFPLQPQAIEPAPPGWPEWVRTRDAAPLPFAPDLALLVRNAERVWYRPNDEEPFVPLFFHDKLRTLTAGSSIEVRNIGEFELLLHDSTRLVARGRTRVDLLAMSPTNVQLRVAALTWLRLAVTAREHDVTLPDGSTLHVAAPPAPAAGDVPFVQPPVSMTTPPVGMTEIVIARADEPAWLGGRATVTNVGSTDVVLRHWRGTVTLSPAHRVTLLLQPPAAVAPAALEPGGAAVRPDGDAVVCRAEQPATVSWSGSAFALPAGGSVRFEPQQGQPFAGRR